ncbi:MAG: NACHT domain-containing protein [Syntrophales bacterium]
MFPGGISDKRGNRYEAKWLVRQLLDVIAGKAAWIKYEGVTPQFNGFEFAVGRKGATHWHQTKINAPNGNWTISALKRENVLIAFKNRLEFNINDRCLFISQDPAKDIRTLSDKAKLPNTSLEEFKKIILSTEQNEKFTQLTAAWNCTDIVAREFLQRCDFLTLPEAELDGIIESYSEQYFVENSASIFPILREYAERQFNRTLTTDQLREDIRENSPTLTFKDWTLDLTLRGKLLDETNAYLQTYNPFGAGGDIIPRQQTDLLVNLLQDVNGPRLVLLTGVAGSGKSGVVRGLIDMLRKLDISHLAFRVDHHLDHDSPREIGQALTGRAESPIVTLKGLNPDRPSVLIIDQVDAVSEVSGRSGKVKAPLLRMIRDAQNWDTLRLVVVCRSFDFDSDPQIKILKEDKRVEQIEVPRLDWEKEVAPFLTSKGIDVTLLSQTQKDLLTLPLHLAVFLEVRSESRSFASRDDLFKNLLLKKGREIRGKYSISWSLSEPLKALSNWMSARQRLDAPQAVLNAFLGAEDILATEHLIIPSRGYVNFFHESFFDYVYARDFVVGAQSLLELLASTEQHLFRRTQVRQIFEALRQDNFTRYLRELESVLNSSDVRYHIKTAVTQWLGLVSDPTEKERNIILLFDKKTEPFPQLVRSAFFSSGGWFDLLHMDGWIGNVLDEENEERRQAVLWWLSAMTGKRTTEVASILDAWWNNDPQRGDKLLDWFGYVKRKSRDHALIDLCVKVLRTRPPGLFKTDTPNKRELLLATWVEESPDRGSVIIRAYFDAWFDAHPGRHPFEDDKMDEHHLYSLQKVAEQSPKAFLDGAIDVLLRSIDLINQHEAEGNRDSTFKSRICSGHHFGADQFLFLFRNALERIAREAPDTVLEFLSKLDASKHEALLHIHLQTIAANGEALAKHLLSHLGNKHLFEAGWHGAEWKSFADAARAAFPFLSSANRNRVERTIFNHQPEISRAIKVAREIKIHGETAPWWDRHAVIYFDLNRSGFEQWCILESIGEQYLTGEGAQHLKTLRRKFPTETLPQPDDLEMHKVGSPITQAGITHMKDDQWLSAIDKYKNEERRYRQNSIDGGANQLARELMQRTKQDPGRFGALMKRIPETANPTYVSHILWGLADAEVVEDNPLIDAIFTAHSRPDRPYGENIARLFEKYPHIGKDPTIFDILVWYVENGNASEDTVEDTTQNQRDIVSISDLVNRGGRLHIRRTNGARGSAVEAISAVLWHNPDLGEKCFEIVEKRITCESLISVRCSLIKPLLPLFNHDRTRCAMQVEMLIKGPSGLDKDDPSQNRHVHLTPLITHHGVHLLSYLLAAVPEVGEKLVRMLLDSDDETMRMVGGWFIIRLSFQDQKYISVADHLIKEGVMYRRLAADVAARSITYEEFRDRAELMLIRFFNDEDKHVRQQADHVFREISSDEFVRFTSLAWAYLKSQSFKIDGSYAFFDALEKATCPTYELVISIAELIVSDLSKDGPTGGLLRDLHHLKDLLKREYAASENNPELRKRLLDVIDKMIEREFYGTDEILKAHERGV